MNKDIKNFIKGLVVFLILVAIVYFSFLLNQPPEALPEDSDPGVFSAGRTLKHVKNISLEKHPIGSKENTRVHDYLVSEIKKLSYEPVLHEAQIRRVFRNRALFAAVRNILVKIPGKVPGKAILVMGHYDSVPDAYGASDDGSAIVTMLETLRILKSEKSLKNDIVFLFTDGEEIGLMGARAFVGQHPWAKEVAVVLNFEASGTTGQSLMFETSENNYWLISQFAKSAPWPTANSLSYEIYRRMPNDTDFTPFKKKGMEGLNFAYIENRFDYHTGGDNFQNTNPDSLQHHGSYALALVKHFADLDLDHPETGNAVYFNTLGSGFAYYPYTWIIPLMAFTLVMLGLVLYLGFRNKFLNFLDLLLGFIGSIIHLLLAPIMAILIVQIIQKYYPGTGSQLLFYHSNRILLGLAALTIGISLLFFRLMIKGFKMLPAILLSALTIILLVWSGNASILFLALALIVPPALHLLFKKGCGVWPLTLGSLLTWGILMAVICFMMPGISFILTWPLLFSLIPVLILFVVKREGSGSLIPLILSTIFALPALLWFSNLAYMMHLSMKLRMIGGTILLVGLLLSLLIPLMKTITKTRPLVIPACLLLCFFFFLYPVITGLEYDARYKKGNTLFYATNGNTGETFWAAPGEPDEWIKQYIPPGSAEGKLTPFFPQSTRNYRVSAVQSNPLPVPLATVTGDITENTRRILKLDISTQREANLMNIFVRCEVEKLQAVINGSGEFNLQAMEGEKWFRIRYYALPEEGINLTLTLPPGQPVEIILTDVITGLKNYLDLPRPENMMSAGDRTIATKRFNF